MTTAENPSTGTPQQSTCCGNMTWFTDSRKQIPVNQSIAAINMNVIRDEGVLTIWHAHDGIQILIVVGGEGYYREKGGEIRLLKHGDVLFIQAGIEHWHTAMSDSEFIHVVIQAGSKSEIVTWLQKRKD